MSILSDVLERSTFDTDIGRIVIPGPTYLGMWARDTAIVCLGLTRLGKLDLVRTLLCRYWAFQIGPDSDPRRFVYRNKGFAVWDDSDSFQPTKEQLMEEVGAFPTCVYIRTPDFPPGMREIYGDRADPDSTAWMIIALHDYCARSGDLDVARELATSVSRALSYLRSRDIDGDELLEQGPNQDWADILLRHGKVAYTQAVWYRGLGAASDLFRLLGDEEQASVCREQQEKVYRAINQILWIPHGYFANYVADNHVSMRRALDTALLVAFGACDETRGRQVLDVLDTLGGPFGPAIVEPGYEPHAIGPSKYAPGQYQNEGSWPWITAYLALAWARVGESQRAGDIIGSLLSNGNDTMYEWIDGLTGERHHANFATAAGALAWVISERAVPGYPSQ